MSEKKKSGKKAIVFDMQIGSLIEGDGITALADNAWFRINKKAAAGTTLPLLVDSVFKTPDSGNAITPIVDDDVYPLTLVQICKADASVANEKGTIGITDDCSNGYNENVPDGFTDISGDISAFMRFLSPGGGLNVTQKAFLNKFYDNVDDDGAGVYTRTEKNDDDILIAILQDNKQIAVGTIQAWLLVPAILGSLTTDKPLKGGQNFDMSWTKGEGPATAYYRTTNSEEAVF